MSFSTSFIISTKILEIQLHFSFSKTLTSLFYLHLLTVFPTLALSNQVSSFRLKFSV